MSYSYAIPEPNRADRRWYTADNVFIEDGLRVWDYDRNAGSVDFAESFGPEGVICFDGESTWDGWFRIKRDKGGHSLMNGERIATRTPMDGAPPPPPQAE